MTKIQLTGTATHRNRKFCQFDNDQYCISVMTSFNGNVLQVQWTATSRPLERATDIAGFYLKPKVRIVSSLEFNLFEQATCIFRSYSTCTSSGQQIMSKIDSFQNANFLISQPNPMM